jgi:hypothetical protein
MARLVWLGKRQGHGNSTRHREGKVIEREREREREMFCPICLAALA